MQNVFDELKRYKEAKKFSNANCVVEEDINIAIVEAQQFNEQKQAAIML